MTPSGVLAAGRMLAVELSGLVLLLGIAWIMDTPLMAHLGSITFTMVLRSDGRLPTRRLMPWASAGEVRSVLARYGGHARSSNLDRS